MHFFSFSTFIPRQIYSGEEKICREERVVEEKIFVSTKKVALCSTRWFNK